LLFALSTEAACELETVKKLVADRYYCADEIDRMFAVASMLVEPKDKLTVADGLAGWDWCKRNFLNLCLLSHAFKEIL